jgi:hypothetical protein
LAPIGIDVEAGDRLSVSIGIEAKRAIASWYRLESTHKAATAPSRPMDSVFDVQPTKAE